MKTENENALIRYSCARCFNCFDAQASEYLDPTCPYCRNNRSVRIALSGRTLVMLVAALILFVMGMGLWFMLALPKHGAPTVAQPAPNATPHP